MELVQYLIKHQACVLDKVPLWSIINIKYASVERLKMDTRIKAVRQNKISVDTSTIVLWLNFKIQERQSHCT